MFGIAVQHKNKSAKDKKARNLKTLGCTLLKDDIGKGQSKESFLCSTAVQMKHFIAKSTVW